MSDIRALRYIFISHNAHRNIKRLSEACSMVGRDHWTDRFGMTNTASSYEFHLIFRVDLKLCNELLPDKKYNLCTDLLIGLLFAMRRYDHGFHDTDAPEDAQEILDEFGRLWKRVMASEAVVSLTERRLDTLASGYVRSAFHDVPVDVLENIQAFNCYVVDLDARSRKVLFELMAALRKQLHDLDYTLEFGEWPAIQDTAVSEQGRKRRRVEMFAEEDDDVHETDEEPPQKKRKTEEWTLEQLRRKSVADLKKICKERNIYCAKGRKHELIDRILNPAHYRDFLKRKYHYEVASKRKSYFLANETQEEVNECYTFWGEYDPRKYKVVNGKVEKRDEYYSERKGNSIADSFF